MRRRTFLTLGNEGIKASESVAGDICLYNKKTQKLIIVKQEMCDLKTYPSDLYKPIGVVFIPGSHNVYGDGSCGVMSLKYTNVLACWGMVGRNTNLPDFDEIATIYRYDTVQCSQSGNHGGDLPSDSLYKYNNPFDTDTFYNYDNEDTYHSPSPYNNDDTRNPEYYKTSSPSSIYNCLSDFDGRGNTDIILALRGEKDYNSWEPEYTNDYPAFSYCDMYKTSGTKQGDWYLPAMGELGYMFVKLKTLNNVLTNIISTKMGETYEKLETYNHLSSTEYDSDYPRFISFTTGTTFPRENGHKKKHGTLF